MKGTKYKINIEDSSEGLVIGKIIVVLIHNNSAVYFITEKYNALLLHDVGVYGFTPIQESYCCVKQDDLVDYYPLPKYVLCDIPIIVPHHSFLSIENNDNLGRGAEGDHP